MNWIDNQSYSLSSSKKYIDFCSSEFTKHDVIKSHRLPTCDTEYQALYSQRNVQEFKLCFSMVVLVPTTRQCNFWPLPVSSSCEWLHFTGNTLASPDHLVFMQLWSLIVILHKLLTETWRERLKDLSSWENLAAIQKEGSTMLRLWASFWSSVVLDAPLNWHFCFKGLCLRLVA